MDDEAGKGGSEWSEGDGGEYGTSGCWWLTMAAMMVAMVVMEVAMVVMVVTPIPSRTQLGATTVLAVVTIGFGGKAKPQVRSFSL